MNTLYESLHSSLGQAVWPEGQVDVDNGGQDFTVVTERVLGPEGAGYEEPEEAGKPVQ